MRLKSDLVDIAEACIDGTLGSMQLEWSPKAAVCVVMASGGYPGSYEKGKLIRGLKEASAGDTETVVFQAGTAAHEGSVVTNGGRVLGVTSLGNGLEEAIARAYAACGKIEFEGAYMRTDIGKKALDRKG